MTAQEIWDKGVKRELRFRQQRKKPKYHDHNKHWDMSYSQFRDDAAYLAYERAWVTPETVRRCNDYRLRKSRDKLTARCDDFQDCGADI